MAQKKVGVLIKEARTQAGLTQEQLARKVSGAAASDVGKVERGEADFTQAQLKQVAKATGVTQSSLLNAPKNLGSKSSATKSSTTKKTTSTRTKKSTSRKSTTTSKSSSGSSMKVSATEKRLVELYRAADTDTKKAAMDLLKGEHHDAVSAVGDFVGSLLNGAIEALGNR